ncbi:hypothetical protein GCM10010872_02490 [Dyella flava]|nr:hypothetical protein GCM10010872_02490 [Dyella flava]
MHIDQRDVWLGGPDLTQALFRRTRLATNANIRLLQDHSEAGSDQLVVIYEYNVNHRAPSLDRYCAPAK